MFVCFSSSVFMFVCFYASWFVCFVVDFLFVVCLLYKVNEFVCLFSSLVFLFFPFSSQVWIFLKKTTKKTVVTACFCSESSWACSSLATPSLSSSSSPSRSLTFLRHSSSYFTSSLQSSRSEFYNFELQQLLLNSRLPSCCTCVRSWSTGCGREGLIQTMLPFPTSQRCSAYNDKSN